MKLLIVVSHYAALYLCLEFGLPIVDKEEFHSVVFAIEYQDGVLIKAFCAILQSLHIAVIIHARPGIYAPAVVVLPIQCAVTSGIYTPAFGRVFYAKRLRQLR